MAFCRFCGESLVEGSIFCESCGAKLGDGEGSKSIRGGNQKNSVQEMLSVRKDTIEEMDRMIAHFEKKREQYDKHEELTNLIIKNEHEQLVPLLVFGILTPFLSLLFTLPFYGDRYVDQSSLGIINVVFALIGVGMIVGYVAVNSARAKNLKLWRREIEEVTLELTAHYTSYGPCLIGMEYSNPFILGQIKETIQEGRADNPREAINIMLDDSHKEEMENLAKRQMEATNRAADNAGTAAWFATASFFLK